MFLSPCCGWQEPAGLCGALAADLPAPGTGASSHPVPRLLQGRGLRRDAVCGLTVCSACRRCQGGHQAPAQEETSAAGR